MATLSEMLMPAFLPHAWLFISLSQPRCVTLLGHCIDYTAQHRSGASTFHGRGQP